MRDEIDDLIEVVIVDADNEDEQLSAFAQSFEDDGRFPFRGLVVGVEVDVMSVDFEGDERRGIVALCRRGGKPYSVSLIDVTPIGPLSLETRQLIAAYRRWSNASPLTSPKTAKTPWVYPRFAPALNLDAPLGLTPHGDWNPVDEYWGEPGDPIQPLCQTVIAAGPRPSFEMEQVIPGADEDDWDSDPIIEAADLHHAGLHREAIRILEDALAIDNRCIDAWGHLGLVAFNTRGPGPAVEFYQAGVAVADASLPVDFGGVLPWGWIDNRPFLRCLHGLALCAWRQRRWDDAAAMFTARVWLDPSGALNDLACLEPVQARQRWTKA